MGRVDCAWTSYLGYPLRVDDAGVEVWTRGRRRRLAAFRRMSAARKFVTAQRRLTGADVLEQLVRFEHDGLYDDVKGTHSGDLARRLGLGFDGRRVRQQLVRLERGLLVERMPAGGPYWRTTDRGREVDATLDRIVARRGGTFDAWSRHFHLSETRALR